MHQERGESSVEVPMQHAVGGGGVGREGERGWGGGNLHHYIYQQDN